MTILKNEDGFIIEVQFAHYTYSWVYYYFRFSFGSLPVFNPAIMENDYFEANEHRGDTLIPTLEEALEKDQPTFWDPTEPDIEIEIKPFLEGGWEIMQQSKNIMVSEQEKNRLIKVDELRKKLGGKLNDDYFTLLFIIDACRLKKIPSTSADAYGGDGPTLRVTVTRKVLQEFVNDLKKEYQFFLEKNRDEVRSMYEEAGLPSPI